MIVLKNLTKSFTLMGQRRTVLDRVNAVFPSKSSVALLGRNGAGKSTLMRLIAGTSDPTSGEILSTGSISFPVGYSGSFHGDMTGAQNTRFVARIYGADTDAMMAWVEEFAELGSQFHLPVRSYSSGMKARLSFGVSMALSFDTYLIDEVTAVGDAGFKKKSGRVLRERLEDAGVIYISHSIGSIREMCRSGAVLEGGTMTYFDDVEEAIARHLFNMEGPKSPLAAGLARPGEAADPETGAPEDFPAGARLLFGIGVAQTATDWLSDYLRRHRACHAAPDRALHYFDIRAGLSGDVLRRRQKALQALSARMEPGPSVKNAHTLQLLQKTAALVAIYGSEAAGAETAGARHRAYLDYLLDGRRNQPVICDLTPAYGLLGPADFTEMAAIGQALFLLVLRDPAERLWAQICAGLPGKPDPATVRAAAEKLLEGGGAARLPEADYARLIDALEASVPGNRVMVLFHEHLFEQDVMDALCDFLAIPPRAVDPPPAPDAPPLPADLRPRLRAALAHQYDEMCRRFGSHLPAAWEGETVPRTEPPADSPAAEPLSPPPDAG